MALRQFDQEENANEQLDEEEESVHIHRENGYDYVVTRYDDPDDDPDYDGEPMKCRAPSCSKEFDYEYECDECGEVFGSRQALAGHTSAHSDEEEED